MRPLLLAVLLGIALGLAGCATTNQPKDPNNVSSIPWNKPAPWESQGPFGGLMQGSR